MPNSSATPASSEPSALYDPPELREDRWEQAGRRLLAKMIGEFAHEGIIEPEPEPERLLDSTASPDLERRATLVPYPSSDREESGFASAPASAAAPASDQARKLTPTVSPVPDRTPADSAPSGAAHTSVAGNPDTPHPRYAPYTLRLDAGGSSLSAPAVPRTTVGALTPPR